MRILITGATGLIGKSLLISLLQVGHKIVVLTTNKKISIELSDVEFYYWNPEKNIIDDKAFDKIDVLISLAGAKINQRWTKKNKKEVTYIGTP